MLACTIHDRSYVPSLKRWFPVDPKALGSIKQVTPVIEGNCDECMKSAHVCFMTQFPDLFVHEYRMGVTLILTLDSLSAFAEGNHFLR
jgi:hypothetical protein